MMRPHRWFIGLIVLVALLPASALAQTTQVTTQNPVSYRLDGITHIYQGWNNCGPATLTMGLTYFGYQADQYPAAGWLKPNGEDKNVSPSELAAYVNTQLDGQVRALVRQGGTQDLLRTLIANQFPVLIEAGYDPDSHDGGWMGHYLLMVGYDETRQVFITQDSFDGPNLEYSYEHIREFWRQFNRVYIPLFPFEREAELLALLGADADETQNYRNALAQAQTEATANPNDAYAWFNLGTNFVGLGMYEQAATAYDHARGLGLPWRMMWYQFGPFEAYLNVARYDEVIALAQSNLNDGGGQWVEETFYYAGLARAAMGEPGRAIANLDQAIFLNANFTAAREARDSLVNQ
ncbi:MAG: hypothetical protein GYB67_04470 [Chloroflexi bacterium]|nr:hypothetical protein [Chloroflexota bacterium]